MNHSTPRVLSFHYTLTNKDGAELDSSSGNDPMTFMEGAGQIIPGLERVLLLMSSGDKKKIVVSAEDAYGDHDPALIFEIPKTQFSPDEELNIGDQFQTATKNGEPSPVFTVTHLTETHVGVDGNHPLSGQELTFDVEIVGVRNATAEEVAHGHAHGEHGHGHHH